MRRYAGGTLGFAPTIDPVRWGFPLAVVVPIVILTLPIDLAQAAEVEWQLDVGAALLLSAGLIWLWRRGREARGALPGAAVIVGGVVATQLALLALTDPRYWWGAGSSWVVAGVAALLASWAGPWPEGRGLLLAAFGCTAATALSPVLSRDGGSLLLLFAPATMGALGMGLSARRQRLDLRAQRLESREAERRRMAAELHDVIAHEISGVVVLAQAEGCSAQSEMSRANMERIEQSGKRALAHIRALVSSGSEQSSGAIEPPRRGDLSDIGRLVEAFAETTATQVSLRLPDDHDVPGSVAVTAHRVVAEALTNVRRHAASATHVGVEIERTPEELRLTVTDDGRGAGLGAGAGSGLTGITERAALIAGTCTAGPVEPVGWRVHVVLPLKEPK